MAGIRSPGKAKAVDQVRMFEIADLLLVVIQIRSGLVRSDVDSKVGVSEKAVGRRARQTANDGGLRGAVIDSIDQRRIEAE
jgi:hypothetical protein